jgi:hypothetical protein
MAKEKTALVRAPFVYFGNKTMVSRKLWPIFEEPELYLEPFAGALGVFLNRPPAAPGAAIRTEVLGDYSSMISNLWRAIQLCPDEAAIWASNICSMADFHAVKKYLSNLDKGELARNLAADPYYANAEAASRYMWLLSNGVGKIGSLIDDNPRGKAAEGSPMARHAFNTMPYNHALAQGVQRFVTFSAAPKVYGAKRRGWQAPMEHYGKQFYCELTGGIVSKRFWAVREKLWELSARLDGAVILCDSFENLITNPLRFLQPTHIARRSNCAVFLDPPYTRGGDYLYGKLDVAPIREKLLGWCIRHEEAFNDYKIRVDRKRVPGYIRVILTSHEGEYDPLLKHGWKMLPGFTLNAVSRMAKDKEKQKGFGREAVYLSPQAAARAKELGITSFAAGQQ